MLSVSGQVQVFLALQPTRVGQFLMSQTGSIFRDR
jgi:hypothetical protein